jgi:hypothetical protein
MPLIISPKTTEKVFKIFNDILELKKVKHEESGFWHGNFSDSFYEGLNGLVHVLFTGYSGATAGQALLEYVSHQKKFTDKEVYFVGSVFAFSKSRLEPGDIAFVEDSYSPDSFEQAIYKNCKKNKIKNFTKPDPFLRQDILRIAKNFKLGLKPTKVYCRISPGIVSNLKRPTQLMADSMWWNFASGKFKYKDFDSGEYESASILATCKLLGLKGIALLDVKDKKNKEKYVLASSEQVKDALEKILVLIKELILENS